MSSRKDMKSPLIYNITEPHSPKKHLPSPSFINIPRKRIRTESVTSTKSSVYSFDPSRSAEGGKNRKLTKAEESRFESKRKRLNNIQNIDKAKLTMYDMIYYNPNNNPMKKTTSQPNSSSSSEMGSKKTSLENIPAQFEKEPTPAPTPPPQPPLQLAPQLKLGPNGEMILDEKSLIIENERDKEMRNTLANAEIVYDDEFSGSEYLIHFGNANAHFWLHPQILVTTKGKSVHENGHPKKLYGFIDVYTRLAPIFQ
jgi:transcription factor TFIIIB component B''